MLLEEVIHVCLRGFSDPESVNVCLEVRRLYCTLLFHHFSIRLCLQFAGLKMFFDAKSIYQ